MHSPIGGISVSAMHRSICSLRLMPSNTVVVSGPLGHRASHGLGTTGGGDAAVHQAQAVLVSTAARKLALGVALNSSWLKVTVTSMVTEMEKLVNHSDESAVTVLVTSLRNLHDFATLTTFAVRVI